MVQTFIIIVFANSITQKYTKFIDDVLLLLQVKAYAEDPLVWHGGMKAGWAKAMLNAQTQINSEISSIKLPFITIHGTGDTLVNIASSQFLYDNAQSEDKAFEVRVCTSFVLDCTIRECLVTYS